VGPPQNSGRFNTREQKQEVYVFGHESAWSIYSERLQKAADALVSAGYATSTVNRDIGALGHQPAI
jgi:hypothetical protein